jgi:DNA repair exonuclease SbcCD ATPase subunit
LGRLAAVLAQAEQEAGSTATRLGRARRIADLATRATAAAAMAGRLTRAEAAQVDVNTCTGELTAIRADAAAVQGVHSASRECAQARAVLDAQATAIILDLEPGADGRVLIDGAPVASTELRAIANVTIDLPGIGRLFIRPAIRDRDTLLGAIARAERKLAGALESAGASDAADAERRLAQRIDLEQRLAQARRALDLYAPADPELGLAAGAEALRNHVAVLRRRVAAELAELDLTEPPPAAGAGAALKAAAEAEAKAAEALVLARAVLTAPRQCRDERAAAAAQASEARSGAEAEVGRLRHEMAEAAKREADEALTARLAEAAREVLSRQDALALVEHARPEDTLAAVDARIARYERAIDAARENHRRLQQDIAVLQSRIEQEEGGGIEEQIAVAERRREDFARERDALQREAEVLELLRDTLLEAEHAAKERYLAPVVRRIAPYLRGLFPGARVHCDEDFRITGMTRDGGAQEEFARLSDGTQEQIAILSRLAFADLLIDRGRPAMVILDDALAFADRDRIERMFDLLAHAARRMQLLVLTCRGDVFARLGGHRLELKTVAGADTVA